MRPPSHSTTPVSTFVIEIPEGLELPLPDPSSPVTPALIQPYESKEEIMTLLQPNWMSIQDQENTRHRTGLQKPYRAEGLGTQLAQRQRILNGYQESGAGVERGSGSRQSEPVASSADQPNLSTEQIRINKEVLLPFFESILGDSNNGIGVYIPQPSSTTLQPLSIRPLRSQQTADHHSPAMKGSATTATTSYSSSMTGIRSVTSVTLSYSLSATVPQIHRINPLLFLFISIHFSLLLTDERNRVQEEAEDWQLSSDRSCIMKDVTACLHFIIAHNISWIIFIAAVLE